MRYDVAVAELFEEGAEMVVVFAPRDGEPGDLIARGIVLNGLREGTGEQDLEVAAEKHGEPATSVYLALSAIDGIMDGPTERQGR